MSITNRQQQTYQKAKEIYPGAVPEDFQYQGLVIDPNIIKEFEQKLREKNILDKYKEELQAQRKQFDPQSKKWGIRFTKELTKEILGRDVLRGGICLIIDETHPEASWTWKALYKKPNKADTSTPEIVVAPPTEKRGISSSERTNLSMAESIDEDIDLSEYQGRFKKAAVKERANPQKSVVAGKGGFKVVKYNQNLEDGNLEVLKGARVGNKVEVNAAQKEIKFSKLFQHQEDPEIVVIYKLRTEQEKAQALAKGKMEKIYIAEVCKKDLRAVLSSQKDQGLKSGQILNWLSQAVTELKVIHDQGYVHQDIKPENMLIHNQNLRLGDFDLVISQREKDPLIAGSPGFRPPESYNEQCSTATDIYALGRSIYEVVNGFNMLDREYLDEIDANVSERTAAEKIAKAKGCKYFNVFETYILNELALVRMCHSDLKRRPDLIKINSVLNLVTEMVKVRENKEQLKDLIRTKLSGFISERPASILACLSFMPVELRPDFIRGLSEQKLIKDPGVLINLIQTYPELKIGSEISSLLSGLEFKATDDLDSLHQILEMLPRERRESFLIGLTPEQIGSLRDLYDHSDLSRSDLAAILMPSRAKFVFEHFKSVTKVASSIAKALKIDDWINKTSEDFQPPAGIINLLNKPRVLDREGKISTLGLEKIISELTRGFGSVSKQMKKIVTELQANPLSNDEIVIIIQKGVVVLDNLDLGSRTNERSKKSEALKVLFMIQDFNHMPNNYDRKRIIERANFNPSKILSAKVNPVESKAEDSLGVFVDKAKKIVDEIVLLIDKYPSSFADQFKVFIADIKRKYADIERQIGYNSVDDTNIRALCRDLNKLMSVYANQDKPFIRIFDPLDRAMKKIVNLTSESSSLGDKMSQIAAERKIRQQSLVAQIPDEPIKIIGPGSKRNL